MKRLNRFPSGDYRVICDYSGMKIWKSQARLTWDGFLVRKDLWEPRQPQDFVTGRIDNQNVPISRPEQADTFITNEVLPEDL